MPPGPGVDPAAGPVENLPGNERYEIAESWRLKGDFIDFCNCAVPCPCTFGREPTDGECEGIIGFRFREGNYGDVDMGGVNVVALARFEGNIWDPDNRADMGMIIDDATNEEQREALLGAAELLTGPTSGGERLAVQNPPGSEVGPGQGPATYGIATIEKVDAFGLRWEHPGRSAKHIPFEWSSEDEF